MNLRKITDLDVSNKTVILRLDLNLPSKAGKFIDTTRIIRSLPTIHYLLEQRAKVVIISHMGRPKGEFIRALSLAPAVDELEKHIKTKVKFATECIGKKVRDKVTAMKFGEILLLENLRFHPGEESNDVAFASELASLGDIFINDTFSCSHRKHASIDAIAKILPSAAGFLLAQELEQIENYLENPTYPFTAIVGGAKISTKLNLLLNLLDKIDYLILSGAMANTFLYALGYKLGRSILEPELKSQALHIIETAKQKQKTIVLPHDFIVLDSHNQIHLRNLESISENEAVMDIGPLSCLKINNIIHKSGTLVWNGPCGAFETPPYNSSSVDIARNIASATTNNGLISIAGGGDTIAAIKLSGLINSISYTSTGGGAFLEWLEGKQLPGILTLSKS
jgi:phosphoglycerate kinase